MRASHQQAVCSLREPGPDLASPLSSPLSQQFYRKVESIISSNCTIAGLPVAEYERKKKRGGASLSLLLVLLASPRLELTLRPRAQSSARRSRSTTSCISVCSNTRTTSSTRARSMPESESTLLRERPRCVLSPRHSASPATTDPS